MQYPATEVCSQYAGRVIRNIPADARTPDWMRERLARSAIRTIHPLVDITNYVMLELGQPMHAFDLRRLNGGIHVRRARAGERLLLLNGQTVELQDEPVIADDHQVLALAGVMGGEASAVGADTTDVFLESACFAPVAVAVSGRRFQLNSDSLYRFERGVDATGQRDALERASELILALFGGEAGPVTVAGKPAPDLSLRLRPARISRVLGHRIEDDVAAEILQRLGMRVEREADAWSVTTPTFRHDLRLEVDLIEEIGRLYGYDRIPARPYAASLQAAEFPEGLRSLAAVRDAFVAHGYLEAVTYSFIDPAVQRRLTPDPAIALDNPIAETRGEMRTTLWSGLLPALRYNLLRQQDRVRLFEIGRCALGCATAAARTAECRCGCCGSALPAQWGASRRPLDLFDLKGDLHGIFALADDALEYRPGWTPCVTSRSQRHDSARGGHLRCDRRTASAAGGRVGASAGAISLRTELGIDGATNGPARAAGTGIPRRAPRHCRCRARANHSAANSRMRPARWGSPPTRSLSIWYVYRGPAASQMDSRVLLWA